MIAVADNDALLQSEKNTDNVFVFSGDLEDAMHTHLRSRDSKPLRALDAIMAQIQNGKLSPELYKLGDFLKQQFT